MRVQGLRIRRRVHLCQTLSQECCLRSFYVMFSSFFLLFPVWMSPSFNLPLICVSLYCYTLLFIIACLFYFFNVSLCCIMLFVYVRCTYQIIATNVLFFIHNVVVVYNFRGQETQRTNFQALAHALNTCTDYECHTQV